MTGPAWYIDDMQSMCRHHLKSSPLFDELPADVGQGDMSTLLLFTAVLEGVFEVVERVVNASKMTRATFCGHFSCEPFWQQSTKMARPPIREVSPTLNS